MLGGGTPLLGIFRQMPPHPQERNFMTFICQGCGGRAARHFYLDTSELRKSWGRLSSCCGLPCTGALSGF